MPDEAGRGDAGDCDGASATRDWRRADQTGNRSFIEGGVGTTSSAFRPPTLPADKSSTQTAARAPVGHQRAGLLCLRRQKGIAPAAALQEFQQFGYKVQ